MRVVIAPDSFKGSISARDAAQQIADGWRSVRPGDDILELPQADGGEGTLDAIEAATPDAVRRSAGTVTGPDGRPVPGEWLELPGGTAVVELAQMSGITLMASPDPLGATTRGLGEVIVSALEHGVRALVIALGGSASTDGGAGALAALAGRPAPAGGVTLLTDVTAPLIGPTGAAAAFGPQKGATPADVAALEERLRTFAAGYDADPATPGAGAAGGTAFGFVAAWGARIQPGAAAIAELTGLTEVVRDADILITGEGRIDATSVTGKVVGHAIGLAAESGTRLVAIAGQVAADLTLPDGRALTSISLARLAGSTDAALADPAGWLVAAGREAAQLTTP